MNHECSRFLDPNRTGRTGGRLALMAVSLLLVMRPGAIAQEPLMDPAEATGSGDLMSLSLTELLDVPVVTASRHPTRHMETPSAVFILTREDIRRSGARTVPDLLRLVPGAQVAQVNTGTAAVTIRGFAQEYATKLLVLLDGRPLYTPVFSGVIWMEQEFMLEDIERIEVIRGPGAAVWGANAMNGVINIITRPSQETQGGLVSVGAGTVERGFGAARYGGRAGTNTTYRVWARAFSRDGLDPTKKPSLLQPADDWQGVYAGVRLDTDLSDTDVFVFNGTVFDQRLDADTPLYSPLAPSITAEHDQWINAGGHAQGRWTRTVSALSTLEVQGYVDHVMRDNPYAGHDQTSADLASTWHRAWGQRHDVVAGAGFRHVALRFDSDFTFAWDQEHVNDEIYSVFTQYDYALVPDRLHLLAGSKVEYFTTVGWEVEPTLRACYTPHREHTFWAAVSRAARTPSTYNQYGRRVWRYHAPGTQDPLWRYDEPAPEDSALPAFLIHVGDRDSKSEELVAWELGYRTQPTPNVWIDLTGFLNAYDDVSAVRNVATNRVETPAPHLEYLEVMAPAIHGVSYGGELTATWQVVPVWLLQAAFTTIQMDLEHRDNDTVRVSWKTGRSPEHQAQLRSLWDVTRDVDCDFALRYVDHIAAVSSGSYLTGDVHLAWRPRPDLELSLVGRDLLDTHTEYGDVDVGPSVYTELTWWFF